MVESNTESQKEMEGKITNLKDQLGKVTEDLRTFEINLFDVERQLQKLTKQQETSQQTVDDHSNKIYATDQALGDLRTDFETSRIQTKQDIDEMKAKHEVYQNQTNQKFDENTNAHISRIPTDEGKADLVLTANHKVKSQGRAR